MMVIFKKSRRTAPLRERQEYKGRSATPRAPVTKLLNPAPTMGSLINHQLPALIILSAIAVCVVVSSVSNQTSDSENDTATDEATYRKQRALNTVREARAKLRRHLRTIRVAREQIAPLEFRNNSQPTVPLRSSITVMSILEFNDVRQTVKTSLYLELAWHDEAMSWNKSHYEGVDSIQLNAESIWNPQLYVANSMDLRNLMDEAKIIYLHDNGTVEADIPILLETTCPMDLTSYPFDEQTCIIKIVSFSKLSWEMYEQNYDESLAASLAFSTEWHLTQVSTRFFSLKGELHPEVVLSLRRKTTFYTVCLVLPMVLTSYMNALVFLVPLQSGEKVSFLVTIFVSNSVYIGFFSSMMPRGLESVPNSMLLLVVVMVESLLVLLATLFVLRRFHGEQAATGSYDISEEVTYQWKDESTKSTDAAAEGVKSASRRSEQKTDDTEPKDGRRVSSNSASQCITASEHNPSKIPKPRIHVKSYLPTCAPLAFVRASKASEVASKLTFPLKAHQLDWVLFTVAFVANTIFLITLYVSSFG